jgi:hypothetical protein
MKQLLKLSSIIFIILLITNLLHASEEDISVILFYNQSRINTDVSQTYSYSSSAYGGETGNYAGTGYGLLYEKPLKNQWSLETGLAYFSRGYTNKVQYTNDQSTYNWSSIYLPIVGRFRPNKVFTGFIGAYGSYAVGSVSVTSQYTNSTNTIKATQDFKNIGFTPFEGGLTYGAGINLHLSNSTTMILEVRINEGLTNIIDTNNTNQTNYNPNVSTSVKAYMRETWIVAGFLI